jgi:hypothetical protein
MTAWVFRPYAASGMRAGSTAAPRDGEHCQLEMWTNSTVCPAGLRRATNLAIDDFFSSGMASQPGRLHQTGKRRPGAHQARDLMDAKADPGAVSGCNPGDCRRGAAIGPSGVTEVQMRLWGALPYK